MIKPNKPAFTLTELTIAMALFSFVLLFAVTAFIQVNKIYVKGITTKRMNDQASAIINNISKNLQQEISPILCEPPAVATDACTSISDSDITTTKVDLTATPPKKYYLCLPNINPVTSYVWSVAEPGKFQKYSKNLCASGAQEDGDHQDLIDGNTQVRAFNINPVTIDGNSAWNLDLVLSTQRSEQLAITGDEPLTTRCTGQVSDQYCSVVHLTTLIRVNN